ncbi:MAG: hypothetical protein ACLTR6_10585 [Clostridium fessum]
MPRWTRWRSASVTKRETSFAGDDRGEKDSRVCGILCGNSFRKRNIKEKFETYEKDKNKEYRALPTEEGGNQRITGVWFEEEYKRTYPYNELACNVVGFALKDAAHPRC